jgi:hypothetical protein
MLYVRAGRHALHLGEGQIAAIALVSPGPTRAQPLLDDQRAACCQKTHADHVSSAEIGLHHLSSVILCNQCDLVPPIRHVRSPFLLIALTHRKKRLSNGNVR